MPQTPRRQARDFRLGEMFERGAQRHPDLPLWLSHPLDLRPSLGTRIQLRDAAALVAETAEQLRAAGVGVGDRVALVKSHRFDISILQGAAAQIGAVPAMLWPHMDADVATELIIRLDRPFVVTDSLIRNETLAKVDLPRLTSGVLTVTDSGLDVERFSPDEPEHPLTLPPDVVMIAHSSGTTGVPKLVGYPDLALGAHTQFQAGVAAALRIPGPIAFAVSYLHGRMVSALGASFARGYPIALLDNTDSETAARMFAEVRPRIAESFPNVYITWERLADHPDRPFSSVRYFINTFDAVHPRTVAKLLNASESRFPLYFQAYGTTETGPLTLRVHTRQTIRRSPDGRCVGYPLPGFTKVRLRQRAGTDDAQRHRGEIECRALGASRVYVGEPERTAPGSPKSWWRTGDLGERGRFRCLHLLDRIVDEAPEIASNLALEDILLQRMPSLSEVVVLPAEGDGPAIPVVCTVDEAPFELAAWHAATADLPVLEAPLHLSWQQVPRSSTWKVRRLALRAQLATGALAGRATGEGQIGPPAEQIR